MITYTKRFPSPYSLLFRLHGAAWIRSIFPASISAFITLMLNLYVNPKNVPGMAAGTGWHHPYTYQTFAFIVGFAIVFRNSTAYHRYNQARCDIQTLAGKLVESVVQVCSFDLISSDEAVKEEHFFRRSYVHLVSLLHAVMLQYLRSDWNLDNLSVHISGKHPIQDSGKLALLKKSSIHLRLSFWSTILCLQTGLDAQEAYNTLMTLLVVDGISESEKDSLYQKMDGGNLVRGPLVPGSVRIETVYSWLHRLLAARWKGGGLKIPAPVLSRTYQVSSHLNWHTMHSLTHSYQVLGDSLNAFNQCRGLADIPFPFPYSQAIVLVLCIYTLTIPLVMWVWIENMGLGIALAFCATFTYWTLNEIARDLEDPFLYEPNDIPLARIQFMFNERILAIERETGSSEKPPSLSGMCNRWLGHDSARRASYQSPESAKYYEEMHWEDGLDEDGDTGLPGYFNCTVAPVVRGQRDFRGSGSGVFANYVHKMNKKMRDKTPIP